MPAAPIERTINAGARLSARDSPRLAIVLKPGKRWPDLTEVTTIKASRH
jgi:hypothetical protein